MKSREVAPGVQRVLVYSRAEEEVEGEEVMCLGSTLFKDFFRDLN